MSTNRAYSLLSKCAFLATLNEYKFFSTATMLQRHHLHHYFVVVIMQMDCTHPHVLQLDPRRFIMAEVLEGGSQPQSKPWVDPNAVPVGEFLAKYAKI